MKLVLEQPTYSLYNHQERIDFYPEHQNSSLIKAVLENSFFSTNEYCSSLSSKRIKIYSLSNQSIMTRTDYSEEHTDSIDYENNTYFHSEVDDCSSFTTITSNLTIQNDKNIDYSDEEIITSSKSNLVELKISQIDQQNHPIRSSVDDVSLNSSMTSSLPSTGKQSNKQEEKKTNEEEEEDDDDDEYYIIVNHRKSAQQLTMINPMDLDDDIESTRLYDTGQHDGMHSDESQCSEDLRYSSSHNILNDELSHTSSTLRQEVISVTKVRCKQRQTWFNSSNNQVDGINVPTTTSSSSSSSLNANMNSTKSTMLLHNCHKNENTNVETPSYDFLQLNSDPHTMKTTESLVSTNNTHDKDASAATASSTATKNFYLIHHQSSLAPIKTFLNQNLHHSNIEFIQMDEQECILEIVDGVVTLVPKVKSIPMNNDHDYDDEKFEDEDEEEEEKSLSEDQISQNNDSPKRDKRSSSIDSSISTPSISEREREQEQERDEISSSSSSRLPSSPSKKEQEQEQEQVQEPFILFRDIPSKSPPLPSHNDQSVDLLDLFSTPPVPSSNSNTNNKNTKNLLDDSLSSVSSYEHNSDKVRSSSPIENQSKPSTPSASLKDELPVKKEELPSPINDEPEIDFVIPKTEPPPAAKPINKARINEFASLLSGAVHLTQPQQNKKPEPPKILPAPSPARSEDQSYSSIRSVPSDRDERESYHTVQSNNTNSDLEQVKKHIDARYNEKIDDRKTIQINTSNIKALFEQKISDTNKALSESNEQLLQLQENKQHRRKAPISYAGVKRNLPPMSQPTNRRPSYQDTSSTMNRYSDHIGGTKEVVIEDKKPEHTHQTQPYGSVRRNNTEQIIRPGADSLISSSGSTSNGHHGESLIAREIRETREKEEELRQQRKKCGLPEDVSLLATATNPNNDSGKSDPSSKPPVKSSSFLSNLDFFNTKTNEPNTSRRSTITGQNVIYDTHGTSSNDERKSIVAQELSRFQDNNVPIIRTASTSSYIHRSSSNQNLSSSNTNNIVQREIEAIRAQEAELRQLGRIQRTSDEHSDPRKYQEFVSPIPKSQSAHGVSIAKPRRETERIHGPMTATSNGILKPKPTNNNLSVPSVRGKFPTPNPTAPIVSSANKTIDYSKLSSADRLELEKRECQEREQELRKQRNSISGTTLSVNSTVNGDSGNVSQDEHEDDQEHYFDKIERLKRTENEKAQAPLVRPTKKLNLSQKWEQMVANKTNNATGDDDDDDKY